MSIFAEMINVFYRLGSEIVCAQSEKEFERLNRNTVLWIDLLDPSGDELFASNADSEILRIQCSLFRSGKAAFLFW